MPVNDREVQEVRFKYQAKGRLFGIASWSITGRSGHIQALPEFASQ
ncbi:hypothetical protein ACFLT1_05070 [Bacteroidota bacterium]